MRRAVIDIGSNTVKLLVADVEAGRVVPVLETAATTRLAEGVNHSGRLSGPAMERTLAVIHRLIRQAQNALDGESSAAGGLPVADQNSGKPIESPIRSSGIRVLATSAVRDAVNAAEFLAACPLPVEVLTGEREAELIFRGVTSDPDIGHKGEPVLVLDVGGGSAEFVKGKNGRMERVVSLPVGAVRLTEMLGDDFAKVAEYLREWLPSRLAGLDATGARMIGTGGGIATLARMARGAADHAHLTLDELRTWSERLSAMPLAERKRTPGLPPDRADIIVAGGAVFVIAMELLGASELTVSLRSLRYGALAEGMGA